MSDFGQQQDFGEDGTRKEGGGRGAKFKSFMAGTKNVSSFLLTSTHTLLTHKLIVILCFMNHPIDGVFLRICVCVWMCVMIHKLRIHTEILSLGQNETA